MTLKNTPHPVGLRWNGDQPVAERYTWQRVTISRERKNGQPGSEPVVPATDLLQNHNLDHIANDIGCFAILLHYKGDILYNCTSGFISQTYRDAES